MKIGVLGTGMVGSTLASKLVALGHEVRMGAREAGNAKAKAWAESAGRRAPPRATFAEAAAFGEIVLELHARREVGRGAAGGEEGEPRGKVVVDVSNPLDFSKGMPPRVLTGPTGESLGEQIQDAFPDARVVKALNTVNAAVMVDPRRVGGESDLFLCGNDAAAKAKVAALLEGAGLDAHARPRPDRRGARDRGLPALLADPDGRVQDRGLQRPDRARETETSGLKRAD